MRRHPKLRQWLVDYAVTLSADGTKLRFKVRPPAEVVAIFKAQKALAISLLKGEALEEPKSAEPVEPSLPVPDGAVVALPAPTRGPAPRPAPTGEDWMEGRAVQVHTHRDGWRLVWRDEKASAEMLAMVGRNRR